MLTVRFRENAGGQECASFPKHPGICLNITGISRRGFRPVRGFRYAVSRVAFGSLEERAWQPEPEVCENSALEVEGEGPAQTHTRPHMHLTPSLLLHL